ncbi:MAG: hypothetical protein ACXVP0_09320 [Bacteroidia bacterium]
MKYRSTLLVMALLAGVLHISCKKNWSCECTVGGAGGVANTGSSATYTAYIKYTDKNDAQSKCDAVGKDNTTNGTYVCHIK